MTDSTAALLLAEVQQLRNDVRSLLERIGDTPSCCNGNRDRVVVAQHHDVDQQLDREGIPAHHPQR